MKRYLALGTILLSFLDGRAVAEPPRIVSIDFDGSDAVIAVDVPAGVDRVVLESSRRTDLISWVPRFSQQVSGPGRINFLVPADNPLEVFRARAQEQSPLPAFFYSGRTDFGGEWVDSPTGSLSPGQLAYDSFGNSSLTVPNATSNPTEARTVEESDLWREHGNRLYFFNSSRGLQIIDLTQKDAPRLVGQLRLPGEGEQMYLLGESHLVLLLNSRCDSGSFLSVIDVSTDRPREVARRSLEGRTLESRLVGTALYTATQIYQSVAGQQDVWEQAVVVSGFDLAEPNAPSLRSSERLSGFGGVVTASPSALFVTTGDSSRPWFTRTLHIFDIEDPAGLLERVAAIPLNGDPKDKFKIHQQGDLLAVVCEARLEPNLTPLSELSTYRLLPAGTRQPRFRLLGTLELARGETLDATRFESNRVYVVTHLRVDPLWVVDFSDPLNPRIEGELQIPGWSTYIEPMGDRLLTLGIDDVAGQRLALQWFNVADPRNPMLLSKVVLGGQWSSSEALQNDKALSVFAEAGLVVIPANLNFGTNSVKALQLVDLKSDTLVARGTIPTEVDARRTLLRDDRVLAISGRSLLTIDVADRDHPVVRSDLELSYPVERVLSVGDWLVEFSGTEVRVSPASQPGQAVRSYALDDLPILGASLQEGQIHLLQGRGSSGYVFYFFAAGGLDQSEPARLQHVVLATDQLPELSLIGKSTYELNQTLQLTEAKALYPQPGLLVWSITGQPNYPLTYWPYRPSLPVQFIDSFAVTDGIGLGAMLMPAYFYPVAPIRSLLAVDISNAQAPQFISEVRLPENVEKQSENFAADGLVFASEARTEAVVVATNAFVITNQIFVSVTNFVWLTNLVSMPVVVTETNVPSLTELNASRLKSPVSAAQSKFVSGWSHVLGLDSKGGVLAWGDNASGAIGSEPNVYFQPTPVPLADDVLDVAATDWQSLALDVHGRVWQWGELDGPTPPLPNDEAEIFFEPSLVPLPRPVSAISAGSWHALALAADGQLWSWGHNYEGELGHEDVGTPQLVPGLYATIAAGCLHNLAIDQNGRVHSWGWNMSDQLGRGGSPGIPGPVELPPGLRFRAIAAGVVHSLALAEDGTVWGWGDPSGVKLGTRLANERAPAPLAGLPPIQQVACGHGHTLALAANGDVWYLGEDPETSQTLFARITSLTNVVKISAGPAHSFALTAGGDLFIWGANLNVMGGSGAPVRLALEHPVPLVQSHIEYVLTTNVVMTEQIEERPQMVVSTNFVPVYRQLRRHWLEVVDYSANPATPVVREPVALPGLLQGISHRGALLYTLGGALERSASSSTGSWLSALAYDDVDAHLVDAKLISDSKSALAAVDAEGVVVVWVDGAGLQSWRVNESGQLQNIDALPLTMRVDAMRLLDGVVVLQTGTGFELAEVKQSGMLASLPAGSDAGCLSTDIDRIAGGHVQGVWLPAGDAGTLSLWRP